jgi:hypothetical protein
MTTVHSTPAESPEPDFEVADVLIEGLPGWTQACNFRVDPDDDTRVRFEYSNGTPVRVRRDSIIATRGRAPASSLGEFDRAAIDRLIRDDRDRADAVPMIPRADGLDTRPEDPEEGI